MTDQPDLLYSELEEDLRASVADLLADHCGPEVVLAGYDGDRSAVPDLWRSLAVDLGLAGLLIGEEHGGHGASAREAAVVLEELGRTVAPVPFLSSAVVATTVLTEAAAAGGATDAATKLLAGLAAGERTAALIAPWSTSPDGPLGIRTSSVAGALDADVLLVPAPTDGGLEIHAVPAEEARVQPVTSLDMSRPLADVTVDTGAGTAVVPAAAGERAVRRALRAGAGLLASEQYGVAARCLAETVAYLKERRQFGRAVGGFQALKHRLAHLYVLVESSAAAARYAAATLAADAPDAEVAAALAQSYCGDAAVRCAEEAIQLHGGIGMTWEHPMHLYLKRAKADQLALGTSSAHRTRLGALVDLPA